MYKRWQEQCLKQLDGQAPKHGALWATYYPGLTFEWYPNVLVVSHVTPIKTVLRLALDAGEGILYRLHLDLASLSIAEFYPDGASVVRLVNQTAYL